MKIGQPTDGSWLNVWGLAAVSEDVNDATFLPKARLHRTDVLEKTEKIVDFLLCSAPLLE